MEKYKKIKYVRLLIILFLFMIFVLSLFLFLHSNNKTRRLFVFPSVDDGKFVVEYRYLVNNPVQGDINLFLDELLLGSSVERTKLLFTRGTKVNSCFVRKGTLYVDLSPEFLQMGNDVIEIQQGVNLLKKNVRKNFHTISKVELFIDGKYAFE